MCIRLQTYSAYARHMRALEKVAHNLEDLQGRFGGDLRQGYQQDWCKMFLTIYFIETFRVINSCRLGFAKL